MLVPFLYNATGVALRRSIVHLSSHAFHSSGNDRTPHTTINEDEVAHFSRLSSEWWDEQGEFSFLHRMNPVRMKFITDKVLEIAREEDFDSSLEGDDVLRGLDVLDVGCGGGLLSEVISSFCLSFK
jgi:polyprenyldihydroxybenzoate methyltransferase/3-demethylubiquinol 3-O-methyltransferase